MSGLVRQCSGARARRVIDRGRAGVPAHAHDWPLLSLFVMGSYTNRTDAGEHGIDGPSALFYRAGEIHANTVGANGFEQLEIEFDPRWLRLPRSVASRNLCVVGGPLVAAMRALAAAWNSALDEDALARLTREFVEAAARRDAAAEPPWLASASRRLAADPSTTVGMLAAELGMHAGWLGEAFRRATGEGLRERAARLRIEHAARLLRETDLPCAAIAADAGFCDQSHMSRSFRRLFGRTPVSVRGDRLLLRRCERTPDRRELNLAAADCIDQSVAMESIQGESS